MENTPHIFTLGLDGEFVMLDNDNELVCMSDYLNKNADFGIDDHGKQCTVEIRSKPSTEPLDIVKSIHNIMQNTAIDIPELLEFEWRCGSFIQDLPLGTHIHFGMAKNILDVPTAARILDNYIGAITILLENKKQGLQRRKYSKTPAGNNVSYGKVGDVRFIKHAKLNRWEYRSCSSFLQSPSITLSILSLAKVVMHEILNNPKFRPIEYITDTDFAQMNVEKILENFPSIWHDIEKMELYPKYYKNIDIIYQLITADPRLSWQYKKKDMKQTWGVVYPKDFLKNHPSLKNLWADFVVAEVKPKVTKKKVLPTPLYEPKLKKIVFDWDSIIKNDWGKPPDKAAKKIKKTSRPKIKPSRLFYKPMTIEDNDSIIPYDNQW